MMRAGRLCGLATALLLLARAAPAQNEPALIRIWSAHTAAPSNHAAIIAECDSFLQPSGGDALAPFVRVLASWHLLQLDRTNAAVAQLEPCLTDASDAPHKAAAELARAWLTRLDRERVRTALQFYYRKKVRYPAALAQLTRFEPLPAALKPPDQDRWSLPWQYRLVGFKTMPGLEDQKYELLASRLGTDSDLKAALARPFADALRNLKPVRVRTAAVAGSEVVDFARGDSAIQLTAGQEAQGLLLAYVGVQALIVRDRSHWILLPRPAAP